MKRQDTLTVAERCGATSVPVLERRGLVVVSAALGDPRRKSSPTPNPKCAPMTWLALGLRTGSTCDAWHS